MITGFHTHKRSLNFSLPVSLRPLISDEGPLPAATEGYQPQEGQWKDHCFNCFSQINPSCTYIGREREGEGGMTGEHFYLLDYHRRNTATWKKGRLVLTLAFFRATQLLSIHTYIQACSPSLCRAALWPFSPSAWGKSFLALFLPPSRQPSLPLSLHPLLHP